MMMVIAWQKRIAVIICVLLGVSISAHGATNGHYTSFGLVGVSGKTTVAKDINTTYGTYAKATDDFSNPLALDSSDKLATNTAVYYAGFHPVGTVSSKNSCSLRNNGNNEQPLEINPPNPNTKDILVEDCFNISDGKVKDNVSYESKPVITDAAISSSTSSSYYGGIGVSAGYGVMQGENIRLEGAVQLLHLHGGGLQGTSINLLGNMVYDIHPLAIKKVTPFITAGLGGVFTTGMIQGGLFNSAGTSMQAGLGMSYQHRKNTFIDVGAQYLFMRPVGKIRFGQTSSEHLNCDQENSCYGQTATSCNGQGYVEGKGCQVGMMYGEPIYRMQETYTVVTNKYSNASILMHGQLQLIVAFRVVF